MKRLGCSTILVAVYVALAGAAERADPGTLNAEEAATVKIVVTKFDVNESALQLSWRIRNDTDHDVWICTDIGPSSTGSWFDKLAEQDGRSLRLRRQFDLPGEESWEHEPRGYYKRLRAGQENAESYFLALPVFAYGIFGPSYPHGEHAERLVLEIGYYDEDLPNLILAVVDVAERLSCDDPTSMLGWDSNAKTLIDRFFPGWRIARVFDGANLTNLRDSVTSGDDIINLPFMGQVLKSEKVLRATLDPVCIPYKGDAWSKEGK